MEIQITDINEVMAVDNITKQSGKTTSIFPSLSVSEITAIRAKQA